MLCPTVLWNPPDCNHHISLYAIPTSSFFTTSWHVISISRKTIADISASYWGSVLHAWYTCPTLNLSWPGIKLEPAVSNYEISLKILVDGEEVHKLTPIKRGLPLCWDIMIPWYAKISSTVWFSEKLTLPTPHSDVTSDSRVTLRVYEKHNVINLKPVGLLEYDISTVVDQPEVILGEGFLFVLICNQYDAHHIHPM